tara:strand:- start:33 stop:1190 length:1158 start_codon:yes stop_codon:yes gene_type:complete
MKLKLKNTPEQVELIKALGSKDHMVSSEAASAFAAFIGPVISKVIATGGTANLIFSDVEYDEDDSPSYPLDLYYNENEGYVTTWSQNLAGGMPTSQVEGVQEMKIATYRLDSAVSFMKRYARKSRLDVISKALERMAQEILVKQERNGWAVVLKALAQASTTHSAAMGNGHILATDTENEFKVNDLNRMLTHMRRLSTSWSGHTPAGGDAYGLTDLFVSPEVKEMIRAFAYQPMHVSSGDGVTSLPDNVREDIYRAAGTNEIYGVRITDLLELGDGKKYNTLFDSFLTTAQKSTSTGIGHGTDSVAPGIGQGGTFVEASDHLVVGLDNSREAFIRPVARQSDSGGTFTALPDDQFAARADKTGFYGFLEEGRVCIDAKAVIGMIV